MHLFEYSPYKDLKVDRVRLENYLKEVWKSRFSIFKQEIKDFVNQEEAELTYNQQPFLRFDGQKFRTQNFIGFIQFEGQTIEIYPKVFKQQELPKELMLRHIFYWFSYCGKLHFPVVELGLDKLPFDSIPEMLIWNFTEYCHNVVSTQPYCQYEQVEESLNTPKGRIDWPNYITNGLANGNYHQVDCIYEPFIYDNSLNRVIKYVCRLLHKTSKITETQRKLEEIFFVLDDVEDVACSAIELNSIILSPAFHEYAPIKEWCERILEQQLYSSSNDESLQWCLLLPMEYVFEDFIAGFIKKHFNNKYIVYPQKSNYYLTTDDTFQLKHDILLENRDTKELIIIDTKYKLRDLSESDRKKGISQSDMYQMVSYAYRRGCTRLILLYPNSNQEGISESTFLIKTDFKLNYEIQVKAIEIPFWSANFNNLETDLLQQLRLLF